MTRLLRALGLVKRDSREYGVISLIPRDAAPETNVYDSPEFQLRLEQAKARLGDLYLAAKANHVKRIGR